VLQQRRLHAARLAAGHMLQQLQETSSVEPDVRAKHGLVYG
jgi:hypothetical protein